MITSRLQRHLASVGRAVAIVTGVVACATLWNVPVQAQELTDLSNGLPKWQSGHAVTTSVRDALPIFTSLKAVDNDPTLPIPADWNFGPGYYRSVIRSYCLHAGTYGPSKGDGYLIAPLKGDRAPLIRNVMLRSQQNPSIAQHDVQQLIWGIEAGASWDSYDLDFRNRTAPLLSANEIAILNATSPLPALPALGAKNRQLPASARASGRGRTQPEQRSSNTQRAVETYSEIRNRIAGASSYHELEAIAVPTGPAPWGEESRKEVKAGPWAYVGDGFFIRSFPINYSTVILEVYRAVSANIKRDEENRIVSFESGGYIIETTYDETPVTREVNGCNARMWNFKSVTFRHPDGREKTVENSGSVVMEPKNLQNLFSLQYALCGDPGLNDLGGYYAGIKAVAAAADEKGDFNWIIDHVSRVGSAWNASLATVPNPVIDDVSPHTFDPTPYAATPANTSKQRLMLCPVEKELPVRRIPSTAPPLTPHIPQN